MQRTFRLRPDLLRYAPGVAGRLGIYLTELSQLSDEQLPATDDGDTGKRASGGVPHTRSTFNALTVSRLLSR